MNRTVTCAATAAELAYLSALLDNFPLYLFTRAQLYTARICIYLRAIVHVIRRVVIGSLARANAKRFLFFKSAMREEFPCP